MKAILEKLSVLLSSEFIITITIFLLGLMVFMFELFF